MAWVELLHPGEVCLASGFVEAALPIQEEEQTEASSKHQVGLLMDLEESMALSLG